LAGQVVGTVLNRNTNPRPRNETLYVRLSVTIVKILGTWRQGEACGGDKQGSCKDVHGGHIVRQLPPSQK
jgi:hypothetical protein